MKKKIIVSLVMMLLIITTVLPAIGMIEIYRLETNQIESTFLDNFEIAFNQLDYTASNDLEIAVHSSDDEITQTNEVYHIYEGLHWKLYVSAYWDPPQEKNICLWADVESLPAGATFDPCHCTIDQVTSTFDWTPAVGQAGTYQIVFYVGESCFEPIGQFTITVIVHQYAQDPQETYEIYECNDWHLTVNAYWVPPQPSRLICLWVDTSTLPEGATFTECHCDYGEVSSGLDWHPQIGQAGEYIITFLVGDSCGFYQFPFSIRVIVYPGCQDYSIELYQVDYTIDDVTVYDSSFGAVDVTYEGKSSVQYFNLLYNEAWVIRNIPLLSCEGVDTEQTVTMSFDLGVQDGVDVTSAVVASSVDDEPREEPPEVTYPIAIITWVVRIFQGEDIIGSLISIPVNEFGMEVDGNNWSCINTSIENQEADLNGCVPTAISNSLKYLKKRHPTKLGNVSDDDIDVDSMEDAVDYVQDQGVFGGTWPDDKDQYMKDNNIPITTRKFPAGMNNANSEASAQDCETALEELKKGQDVELRGRGHTVMIVGMAKLKNGKWVIYVAHDTDQGDLPNHRGGQRVEKVMYDPSAANPVAEGGWALNGNSIRGFVVECPDEPPAQPTGTYSEDTDTLKLKATDPDGGKVRFGIDWDGDGTIDEWTDFVDSDTEIEVDCDGRTRPARVIAEDEYGARSDWSSIDSLHKLLWRKTLITKLQNFVIWAHLIQFLQILSSIK